MKTTFEDETNEENDELHLEEEYDEEDNELIEEIEQIAKVLAADCQINDWVAVLYFGNWYLGVVQNVSLKTFSSVNLLI